MGIVVCIAMLIGVLALLRKRHGAILQRAPAVLLILGLWNFAWYGLRHLGSFWGHAALATGIVMLLTGILLLVEIGNTKTQRMPILLGVYNLLRPIRGVILIALLAGFLLYAVTLIQLNLGYPIIR